MRCHHHLRATGQGWPSGYQFRPKAQEIWVPRLLVNCSICILLIQQRDRRMTTMPKNPDDHDNDLGEMWPAIMRIGTVARYLDCSVSTVNEMIAKGAFPAIKYGPTEGMRGVR